MQTRILPTRMKSILLPVVIAALFMASGCRRRSTPTAPTPAPAPQAGEQNSPTATKGASGAALASPAVPNSPQAEAMNTLNRDLQSGNPQVVIARLNELLAVWEMSGKPLPGSVDDFVRGGLITQAPVPPGGGRYVINPKTRTFVVGK